MPKPPQLHSKVKAKGPSIQKPCKLEKDSSGSYETDHEYAVRQFELELCWCIQQLERTLHHKKGSEKQIQDTWKVLQVLKNNNQPIIRKRQLMRSHFGDYRAKMLAEEKKLAKMASKMKISEKPDNPKATFLRKSLFQTTGDSSFRFNFDLAPEHVDCSSNENTNIGSKDGNPSDLSSNTNANDANIATTAVTSAGDGNIQNKSDTKDTSSKFKFTFSGTEFKFNFDVDNSEQLFRN